MVRPAIARSVIAAVALALVHAAASSSDVDAGCGGVKTPMGDAERRLIDAYDEAQTTLLAELRRVPECRPPHLNELNTCQVAHLRIPDLEWSCLAPGLRPVMKKLLGSDNFQVNARGDYVAAAPSEEGDETFVIGAFCDGALLCKFSVGSRYSRKLVAPQQQECA
uniref:Leishmanolysin-like peptidase n=1 Tax=Neobodo designis TaxID=312471 RepID=A0A7S1LX04_NEODS